MAPKRKSNEAFSQTVEQRPAHQQPTDTVPAAATRNAWLAPSPTRNAWMPPFHRLSRSRRGCLSPISYTTDFLDDYRPSKCAKIAAGNATTFSGAQVNNGPNIEDRDDDVAVDESCSPFVGLSYCSYFDTTPTTTTTTTSTEITENDRGYEILFEPRRDELPKLDRLLEKRDNDSKLAWKAIAYRAFSKSFQKRYEAESNKNAAYQTRFAAIRGYCEKSGTVLPAELLADLPDQDPSPSKEATEGSNLLSTIQDSIASIKIDSLKKELAEALKQNMADVDAAFQFAHGERLLMAIINRYQRFFRQLKTSWEQSGMPRGFSEQWKQFCDSDDGSQSIGNNPEIPRPHRPVEEATLSEPQDANDGPDTNKITRSPPVSDVPYLSPTEPELDNDVSAQPSQGPIYEYHGNGTLANVQSFVHPDGHIDSALYAGYRIDQLRSLVSVNSSYSSIPENFHRNGDGYTLSTSIGLDMDTAPSNVTNPPSSGNDHTCNPSAMAFTNLGMPTSSNHSHNNFVNGFIDGLNAADNGFAPHPAFPVEQPTSINTNIDPEILNQSVDNNTSSMDYDLNSFSDLIDFNQQWHDLDVDPTAVPVAGYESHARQN